MPAVEQNIDDQDEHAKYQKCSNEKRIEEA